MLVLVTKKSRAGMWPVGRNPPSPPPLVGDRRQHTLHAHTCVRPGRGPGYLSGSLHGLRFYRHAALTMGFDAFPLCSAVILYARCCITIQALGHVNLICRFPSPAQPATVSNSLIIKKQGNKKSGWGQLENPTEIGLDPKNNPGLVRSVSNIELEIKNNTHQ